MSRITSSSTSSGGHPTPPRLNGLTVSELLLEPSHHPETTVDEHLDIPYLGQGSRPGIKAQMFDTLFKLKT